MGRSILSVVLGIVAGVFLVAIFESLGHLVYPPPPGLDPWNPESVKAAIAKMPVAAFVLVLLAWFLATIIASCLAAYLARRAQTVHALIIGAFLMAAAIMNMLTLPHPLWFWVVALLIFFPASWFGALIASRLRRAYGKSGMTEPGSLSEL